MKSNKGLATVILISSIAVIIIGIFLYVKRGHYEEMEDKFFSLFDKKITLDFSNSKAPLVTIPLPKVEAGPDISIKYPKTSVTLKGTATAPDGGPLIYAWYKLSGGIATLVTPFSDTTVVKGLKKGKYLFRLIATDSKGFKSADEVIVTMEGGPVIVAKAPKKKPETTTPIVDTQPTISDPNPPVNPDPTQPSNVPPYADAGRDQNITPPASSVTLSGSGGDTDGSIISYSWVQVEGNTATITSPSEATTTVTDLSPGSYRFQLIVTDDQGASANDLVGISVDSIIIPPENILPTASAGPDQYIILPDISATLTGSGNDPDGLIVSYEWTQIEGGFTTITSPNSPTTTITELTMGTYVYQLIVTDDQGASASSTVTVNVSDAE